MSAAPLFGFFALLGPVDAPGVVSVPVTADLQRSLSAELQRQLDAFDLEGAARIPYQPQYRPDEGELFAVPFRLPEPLSGLSRAPTLPPLSAEALEQGEVRALVGVRYAARAAPVLCFQAVDARQILSRRRLSIVFRGGTFTADARSGLVVRDGLSAVHRGGTLFFAAEAAVRRFLDLSALFGEATDAQVRAFLDHAAFAVEDRNALERLADGWVRRKISSITERGILQAVSLARLVEVGAQFGVVVATRRVEGARRLLLPAEKPALKSLLRLLDQDYLPSPLTGDRFQVSSKRRLTARRTQPARPAGGPTHHPTALARPAEAEAAGPSGAGEGGAGPAPGAR